MNKAQPEAESTDANGEHDDEEFIPADIRNAISQAIAAEMPRLAGACEEILRAAVERVFDATFSHSFLEQDGAIMAVNELAIDYSRDLDTRRGLQAGSRKKPTTGQSFSSSE